MKSLENDLSTARQENALAQLRDLAGLAFIQASQKNYGLAAGTSEQFFIHTREMANRTQDVNGRKALENLLASQDKIAAELAKGDPEALAALQVLFETTRQAAGVGAHDAHRSLRSCSIGIAHGRSEECPRRRLT